MYIFLNRNNVSVDTVSQVRYVKQQYNPDLIIGCDKAEGEAVIGSDCNSFYPLMSKSTADNAVTIVEIDSLPTGYRNNMFSFDGEKLVPIHTLEEYKLLKQEENKVAFALFLKNNPLLWKDGKYYGVSEEDQAEISLNINQYTLAVQAGVENPRLEWHARQEACQPWTLEDLTSLSLAIAEFVYPYYNKMQAYKTQIFAAETYSDLYELEFKYEKESI